MWTVSMEVPYVDGGVDWRTAWIPMGNHCPCPSHSNENLVPGHRLENDGGHQERRHGVNSIREVWATKPRGKSENGPRGWMAMTTDIPALATNGPAPARR